MKEEECACGAATDGWWAWWMGAWEPICEACMEEWAERGGTFTTPKPTKGPIRGATPNKEARAA